LYMLIVPPAEEPAPFPWLSVLAAVGLSVVVLVGTAVTLYLVQSGKKQEVKTSQSATFQSPLMRPDSSTSSSSIRSPFRLDNPPKREDFGKPPKPEIPSTEPS